MRERQIKRAPEGVIMGLSQLTDIYVMLQVDELPYFRIHEGGCVNENDMYIGMEEN